MWEDQHRWAVYAEEDDGGRTLLYSGRAASGAVSAAVGSPSPAGAGPGQGGRAIVVIEQDIRRARLLLIAYDGPGRRRFLDATGTQLDAWADRVAEETR